MQFSKIVSGGRTDLISALISSTSDMVWKQIYRKYIEFQSKS